MRRSNVAVGFFVAFLSLVFSGVLMGQERPVWKFTGITLRPNWVNAGFRRPPRVDVTGGDVELNIRGTGTHCAREGTEIVQFRWSFDRDISLLRQGDNIEVRLHVRLITADNICKGQLESWSYTEAITSNSAGYSESEARYFEDRVKFIRGDSARGGEREPSLRNALTILNVDPGPATTKQKMRFAVRVSGPCDDPQPYTCGNFTYQYNYELAGGSEESKACGYAIGSGILSKWRAVGGELGVLGCARSGESEAAISPKGTSGRYALFRGWADAGVIIWHRDGPLAGKAFEVHGAIAQRYQALGGTGSRLGFPVSDEYTVAAGRRSDFEGGYIFWEAATGKVTVVYNV